jgi:tRNA G18 (ribose-2'-O)-methylase SpoU|eukprot:COSAG01_NODE_18270_length_1087_cov_1.791498_2_plen_72_part_00
MISTRSRMSASACGAPQRVLAGGLCCSLTALACATCGHQVAILNITSDWNVGALMRTAALFKFEQVGIGPY